MKFKEIKQKGNQLQVLLTKTLYVIKINLLIDHWCNSGTLYGTIYYEYLLMKKLGN